MIPAVFQVTFALLIAGTIAIVFEHPWDARPDAQAIFSIIWLGFCSVPGLAYPRDVPPKPGQHGERPGTARLVAYEIPVVGIILGFSSCRNRSTGDC